MSKFLERVFILYGGYSADGAGPGVYKTFTTDPGVAYAHWKSLRTDPYSTGHVMMYSLTEEKIMSKSNWKQFGYDFERAEKEEERDQLQKRLQTLNQELGD